jgi:4-methyl-5(b-hydroxyethyl)-thiazole monophosphate biosynthesis
MGLGAVLAVGRAMLAQGYRYSSASHDSPHPTPPALLPGCAAWLAPAAHVPPTAWCWRRGPGTAFEFALALVREMYGEEKMREVAGPMVMP